MSVCPIWDMLHAEEHPGPTEGLLHCHGLEQFALVGLEKLGQNAVLCDAASHEVQLPQ